MSPYTDAYEAIKSIAIIQAATTYNNPETGETMILILDEAIWIGDQLRHTLINPNQLHAYRVRVQDNPFNTAPLFLSMEGNKFSMPLTCNGTILCAPTRTPTDHELHTCPHVILSSEHEWDPQNVWFPKALRTVEEEVSRTIGAIMKHGEDQSNGRDAINNACLPLLDIRTLSQRMIASIKIQSVARYIAATEIEVQDIPQDNAGDQFGGHKKKKQKKEKS